MDDKELAKLLEEGRPKNGPTAHSFIIHQHYKDIGAQRYDIERFYRLCGAWNERPVEMAARIGMEPEQLRLRIARGHFNTRGCYAESILLQQFERFIEWHHTGAERKNELFLAPRA
jgi:hypothetical protein